MKYDGIPNQFPIGAGTGAVFREHVPRRQDLKSSYTPWRCLIVEDDAENARYIAKTLKENGYETEICGDIKSALNLISNGHWDLVILDRMLPGEIDGLTILAELRSQGYRTPVLVLSALSSLDQRVRGLKAGGDDYLTKPFAISELIARAEAVIRRSNPMSESRRLEVGDLSLDLFTRKAARAGRMISLQPRELKLLAYFMSNANRLLTRTMLLEAVWDYRFDPRTNVIDVHVSRLRNKIEHDGELPLIFTERGLGYIMKSPEKLAFKSPDA